MNLTELVGPEVGVAVVGSGVGCGVGKFVGGGVDPLVGRGVGGTTGAGVYNDIFMYKSRKHAG
jgi:hypothetical protein